MYGFISGITDADDINYCPRCGSSDLDRKGDGTAICNDCGYGFGVVETENSSDKERENE